MFNVMMDGYKGQRRKLEAWPIRRSFIYKVFIRFWLLLHRWILRLLWIMESSRDLANGTLHKSIILFQMKASVGTGE